ncbi:uncharacterized protein [Antedon mediterranea]|uniref:uncharacterized protein n=1 Tax=Antedon mediterranea TaxID=105859 RepID=UPI003AF53A2A
MGLIAPVILPAKILLQEVMRDNKGWDEPIDGKIKKRWQTWLEELKLISNIKIPRCVNFNCAKRPCQLHMFADASERGYGIVAFVRCVVDGAITCNNLYSRSRVSPLKRMTIPQLELTAATLAVKSASLIQSEIDYNFDDILFWTDSMLVINYINNVSTRFSTFVANRLNVIQEGSTTSQWRHVGTKDNPADIASRRLKLGKIENEKMWFRGPEFLWQETNQWPQQIQGSHNLKIDDPEVKKVACPVLPYADTLQTLAKHYSSWSRLRRATAWMIKLKQVLRKKDVDRKYLTVSELKAAEVSLVRNVQRRSYIEEIKSLEAGNQIKKSSPLVKLDPFWKMAS